MRLPIHTISDPDASPDFHRDGADLERFWKEVACEGLFIHPETGQEVPIDKPRMDRWVARFGAMQEEKIPVTLPYGHRNLFNDKENAGFAEALEVRQRDDGRFGLWGKFHVPKASDAENIGTTIRGTSIGINFNLKSADGQGGIKEWGEVIDHVALTNHPVITDTEDFSPVEDEAVPEAALGTFRQVYSVAEDDEAKVHFAHLSRAALALSDKAWSEVDKAKLPASCFLHVGDPKTKGTWKLPVYEGSGALVDGPGGGKVYARRGALNRAALSAAAGAIAGARGGVDLPAAEKKKVAKRLASLMTANDLEVPAGLKKAAGIEMGIDTAWLEVVAADETKVPTLKELFRDREVEDQLWRATSALNEVLRRVVTSDSLTGEEKKARIDAAVVDFADLFVAMEPKIALEAVRAELLSLACPSPAKPTPEVRDDKRSDLGTEENEMKPSELIALLKPHAARLELSVEGDDDKAAQALLSSVLEKLPKPEAPETEREKRMRLDLEQIKADRRDERRAAFDGRVKVLLERGSITKEQAETLRKLRDVETAKAITLSKEGEEEVAKEVDVDVVSLTLSFAEGIPAGMAFGRTVVRDPRPEPDEGEKKAQDEATRRLLSRAGADPETGVVGGKGATG